MRAEHFILVHDNPLLLLDIAFTFRNTAWGILLSARIRELIFNQPRGAVSIVGVVQCIASALVLRMACQVQILVIIHIHAWGFADSERPSQLALVTITVLGDVGCGC